MVARQAEAPTVEVERMDGFTRMVASRLPDGTYASACLDYDGVLEVGAWILADGVGLRSYTKLPAPVVRPLIRAIAEALGMVVFDQGETVQVATPADGSAS